MRYLPLTDADRTKMLDAIGAKSIDELYNDVPDAVYDKGEINIPNHKSEMEVVDLMSKMASKNISASSVPFFIGAGCAKHYIPSATDYLIQRGEFLTAYTPYQPEVSQGTLQVLFEFQTQVAMIMGMEIANASMYDGATATAEAVSMASRITKRKKAIISGGVHPHFKEVIKGFTQFIEIECDDLAPDVLGLEDLIGRIDEQTACVVVQLPNFLGGIKDYTALAGECHKNGTLLIVANSEPLAFGAIKSPGEMGADIVTAEALSLTVGMSFGGPALGLLATKKEYIRNMPGRICGQTTDSDGKRGFVLTLSTREQHIRREKATSNICTNSGLMATAFSINMTMLGEKGYKSLALQNHAKAVQLKKALSEVAKIKVLNTSFFNEFVVDLGQDAANVCDELLKQKILGGVPLSKFYPSYPELRNHLLVCATEVNKDEDINLFATKLAEVLNG